MGTALDAGHIYVSREQAYALVGVGKDRFQQWITADEITTYLITPTDNHAPGRLPTVFRLADVYAAKQRAGAPA